MAAAGFLLDLSQALLQLLESGLLCDTELLTDTKSLWAHSIVLAAASKSLCRAFVSASLLSRGCQYKINLSGYDLGVVETVVRFMYTGQLPSQHEGASDSVQAEKIFAVCACLGIPTEKLQLSLTAVDGKLVAFQPYVFIHIFEFSFSYLEKL
jgi:hypothetical protein